MVWEAILLFDIKHVSTYEPTVTYISTRISALGNTPALIHFLLNLVWHINQAKSIKHPVDVCHAPNITQRFRTVNYCSDLFYIAQRQQHRAPRQTFAVLSPVNPELFCVCIWLVSPTCPKHPAVRPMSSLGQLFSQINLKNRKKISPTRFSVGSEPI